MSAASTRIKKSVIIVDADMVIPSELELIPSGNAGSKTTIYATESDDIELYLPSQAGNIASETYVDTSVADLATQISPPAVITPSAGGTTVIDNTSANVQIISGTDTQTVRLDFTEEGKSVLIVNRSSETITVEYMPAFGYTTLTTIRPEESIRAQFIGYLPFNRNYNIERIEANSRLSTWNAVTKNGGTTVLSWFDENPVYNCSGVLAHTMTLPEAAQPMPESNYGYGSEIYIYNNDSAGNITVNSAEFGTPVATIYPNEALKFSINLLDGWVIETVDLDFTSAGNSFMRGFRNGDYLTGRNGSSLLLPSRALLSASNTSFLKTPANSANANYGGSFTFSASGITDNTNVSIAIPNAGGTMVLQDAPFSTTMTYGLTSGSVTYGTYHLSNWIRHGNMVTIEVRMDITAISSPVNTALTIGTLPVTAWSSNNDVPVWVACQAHNCTITGQLFAKISRLGTTIQLYSVNNGVTTAISAASFLQANSQIGFQMTYRVD